MIPESRFEPSPDFADPRLVPGFQTELWPKRCDLKIATPPLDDRYERRCLEFLAAYYQINAASKRLLATTKSDTAYAALIQDRDNAIQALEKLEDRYAPIGFFGEPEMDGVIYQKVRFIRPEPPNLPARLSTHAAKIRIPGLEDIPESELKGQICILRMHHGKMDL